MFYFLPFQSFHSHVSAFDLRVSSLYDWPTPPHFSSDCAFALTSRAMILLTVKVGFTATVATVANLKDIT